MDKHTGRQYERFFKGRTPFGTGRCEGCGENCLDGNRYLVILGQNIFNPNLDKTLLAEDQIKCYGVKVFLHPIVFCGEQLIDYRYQLGSQVKLGISWDVSTIFLNVRPQNIEDINGISSLHPTCG